MNPTITAEGSWLLSVDEVAMETFGWFKEEFDKVKDTEEFKQSELEDQLEDLYKKISENTEDLDPAFSKVVDEHFWELF